MKIKPKNLIWISIGILLIFLLLLIFCMPGKKKSFEIEDKCGPMVNLISHTIQNEGACRAQCKSQCETKDMAYKKVEFTENTIGCHNCTCFCKEQLLD